MSNIPTPTAHYDVIVIGGGHVHATVSELVELSVAAPSEARSVARAKEGS